MLCIVELRTICYAVSNLGDASAIGYMGSSVYRKLVSCSSRGLEMGSKNTCLIKCVTDQPPQAGGVKFEFLE